MHKSDTEHNECNKSSLMEIPVTCIDILVITYCYAQCYRS